MLRVGPVVSDSSWVDGVRRDPLTKRCLGGFVTHPFFTSFQVRAKSMSRIDYILCHAPAVYNELRGIFGLYTPQLHEILIIVLLKAIDSQSPKPRI